MVVLPGCDISNSVLIAGWSIRKSDITSFGDFSLLEALFLFKCMLVKRTSRGEIKDVEIFDLGLIMGEMSVFICMF